MKILADENIPKYVCDYLRQNNVDIISINDIKKGASDDQVMEIAIQQQRALLTNDEHFYKYYRHLNHYGIIWLKTQPKNYLDVISHVINKLQNCDISNKVMELTKNDRYTLIYKRKSYLPEVKKSFRY